MSWQTVLTVLTALTVVARFSTLELILIVRVPARPSRLKAISMPSIRRNVCARRTSQSRGPAAGLTAFSLPFAEPNARASAAVFINEHNARGF
jgi:hypothetical protein